MSIQQLGLCPRRNFMVHKRCSLTLNKVVTALCLTKPCMVRRLLSYQSGWSQFYRMMSKMYNKVIILFPLVIFTHYTSQSDSDK